MNADIRTCWSVVVLTVVTSVTPWRELVASDAVGTSEQLIRSSIEPPIGDVELMPDGLLTGQIINAAGQPLAGEAIVVEQSGGEPIKIHSDQRGRFRLHGLRAGLCRIGYGETMLACRCWSPKTAPPAATRELLLITGEPIERGQRAIADLLTGPVLIGLIIAAAVIIPIAVHNSQTDAS